MKSEFDVAPPEGPGDGEQYPKWTGAHDQIFFRMSDSKNLIDIATDNIHNMPPISDSKLRPRASDD